MKKKWSEEEEIFLKNNIKKITVKEISDKLNRPINGVTLKAFKLGIKIRKWSKEEDELLIQLYPNYPSKKLIEFFINRSESAILNRGYILGLQCNYLERLKHKKYKYLVNHNFFSEYTNENCYWAGFISADGWVMTKGSLLGLKLSIKDESHLNYFKKVINSESPIKYLEGNSFGKIRKFCQLNIYSNIIIKDLRNNFNVIDNKTFINIHPQKIENIDNKLAFIIGLLDGDGSIYKHNNFLKMTFLGTFDMLSWVKKTLEEIVGELKPKINKNNNIYSFTISNKPILKIIEIINEKKIYHLNRKIGKYGKQ